MSTPAFDINDVYDALSPTVQKLEMLSRLSPVLPTDREQVATMRILMDVVSDYAAQLRCRLETLVNPE